MTIHFLKPQKKCVTRSNFNISFLEQLLFLAVFMILGHFEDFRVIPDFKWPYFEKYVFMKKFHHPIFFYASTLSKTTKKPVFLENLYNGTIFAKLLFLAFFTIFHFFWNSRPGPSQKFPKKTNIHQKSCRVIILRKFKP